MSSEHHQALFVHPSGLVRARGAVLPHPVFDPNPRLTLALLRLWDVIRPSLTFYAPSGHPGIRSSQGLTPSQIFESIKDYLVRLFLLFHWHV